VTLTCWSRAPHPDGPTFAHFHANGEVVADYVPDWADAWHAAGFNVFLAEYRGYGGSSGEPALVAMLDDVDVIYEAVGVPAARWVVYGRPIGSIYALGLAGRHPGVAALVLESGTASPLERVPIRVAPEELGGSLDDLKAEAARHLDYRAKLEASLSAARTALVVFEEGDHITILALNGPAIIRAVRLFWDEVGVRGGQAAASASCRGAEWVPALRVSNGVCPPRGRPVRSGCATCYNSIVRRCPRRRSTEGQGMLHARRTVFLALLAMGTASTTMPLEAWAKKGRKGAKKKAGKADKARVKADKKAKRAAKKARKKAARMEKAGKRAYVKGKYDDALIAFEAAYEAFPQPKHLYNMARCHEQQGKLAKAADFYEQYLREAPDAEDREDVETRAELLTKKLTKTMGRLEILSTPVGAVVKLSGEGTSKNVKTPWSGWLAPGGYDLTAMLDEHEELTRKVAFVAGERKKAELKLVPEGGKEPEPPADEPKVATGEEGELLLQGVPEGATVTLDGEPLEDAGAGPVKTPAGTHRVGISLGERPPVTVEAEVMANDTVTLDLGAVLLATDPAAGQPAPEPAAEQAPATSAGPSTLAWAALGVGVAGLAAGAVFGVLAGQAEDDQVAAVKAAEQPGAPSMVGEINDHNEAARRNGVLANIGFGLGTVGVLAGGLLLLADDPEETAWVPTLMPGAAGVAGRF